MDYQSLKSNYICTIQAFVSEELVLFLFLRGLVLLLMLEYSSGKKDLTPRAYRVYTAQKTKQTINKYLVLCRGPISTPTEIRWRKGYSDLAIFLHRADRESLFEEVTLKQTSE